MTAATTNAARPTVAPKSLLLAGAGLRVGEGRMLPVQLLVAVPEGVPESVGEGEGVGTGRLQTDSVTGDDALAAAEVRRSTAAEEGAEDIIEGGTRTRAPAVELGVGPSAAVVHTPDVFPAVADASTAPWPLLPMEAA